MAQEIEFNGAEEMKDFAEKFAREISDKPLSDKAMVIGLDGDLGSGKTTFAQGFAKGLGVKGEVRSPTFVIMKKYEIKPKTLIHIDAYRLKDGEEIKVLGWDELVKNSGNIILIEWAENIKNVMPSGEVRIFFEHGEGERRKIKIQ